MNDPSEINHLLNVKQTQLQMIIDRGFQIPGEEEILGMTEPQFNRYVFDLIKGKKITSRVALSRFYVDEIGSRRTVLVYYANKKVSKHKKGDKKGKKKESTPMSSIEPYVALVKQYVPDTAILIISAKMSSYARDFMNEELTPLRTKQELFFDEDLTYNPTKHVDVPIHELVPPNQAIEKLQEMRVSITNVPLMKTNDPVAKYYGWTPGSLIRIYRNDDAVSILAPRSINYRVLVE